MLCVVCKVDKDPSDFNWRNKTLMVRKNHCRDCDRVMRKRSYEKHKEKSINAVQERKASIKRLFKQWKSTLQCQICTESEEVCLDFHHLDPSVKEEAVSKLLDRSSKELVIRELNKCVVLCACCHRKVHKYGWEAVANGIQPVILNVNASLVFNGNIPSFQVGVEGSSPS